MNPCIDCQTSAQKAWHGFHAGCKGCAARAASRSIHFKRVRDAGMLDRPYRALLAQFDLMHDDVKAAFAADALTRSGVDERKK